MARSGSILVRSLVVWLMIAPPELMGEVRPVAAGPYSA